MRSLGSEFLLAGGDDATPHDTGEGGVDAIFSAEAGESPAIFYLVETPHNDESFEGF